MFAVTKYKMIFLLIQFATNSEEFVSPSTNVCSDSRSFEKPKIHDFLKKDIETRYLTELENYFKEELKGFTTPNFFHKSDYSISNLKDISRTIKNSQIAIISGEAGYGKTSLSK